MLHNINIKMVLEDCTGIGTDWHHLLKFFEWNLDVFMRCFYMKYRWNDVKSTKNREKSQKWKELTNPVFMRLLTDVMPLQNEKNQKNQKKLKKVVDICWVWWYYNQVAAIRQRQKLKETLMNTGFFKNRTLITEQKDNLENSF